MIHIDGSYGEGGGQILRSALALSLVTGKPFRIANIRAGRKKPGLMRQHLTAVNAAAKIGNAEIRGNQIGSREFSFKPCGIAPGSYRFAIGTAGSCTLVLQSVLPALMVAEGPSELILEGGTHNPFAPPFGFLKKAFLPLISKMGPDISAILECPGFFPAGGGRFKVTIDPATKLKPLKLVERGPIQAKSACAMVANLPRSIAKREIKVVAEKLGLEKNEIQIMEIKDAKGPGNVLTIKIAGAWVTEVFTGFGRRGVSAEKVAADAVAQARAYLAKEVPVGPYLADQLLLPMAMAGKGGFRTPAPTKHTLTNMEIVKTFLEVDMKIVEAGEGIWEVTINP